MTVPVVISTGPDRGHWVRDALDSISLPDVTVCKSQTGGELGAIRMIYHGTRWPRWLMLHDSCVVKDQGLFDLVNDVNGPLLIAPRPCMYLAVYERSILDRTGIPDLPAGTNRALAIAAEVAWMDRYVATAGSVPVLFPEFTDANATRIEGRYGRTNLVLENEYLIKYKGTWQRTKGVLWPTSTPPSTS